MKNQKKSLFLDRDGVINKQIIGGYVTSLEKFEFLPNVIKAIVSLSYIFDYIIVVTNQQGIGKGIFSEKNLCEIHQYMYEKIITHNGRIDAIYYAPNLENEKSPLRKPGIGMALQAKKEFPEINLSHSIMVGDSLSDIQFGKNAGMTTAYLTKSKENIPQDILNLPDYIFEDLWEMSQKIQYSTLFSHLQ